MWLLSKYEPNDENEHPCNLSAVSEAGRSGVAETDLLLAKTDKGALSEPFCL